MTGIRERLPKHPERLVLYLLLPITAVAAYLLIDIGDDTEALRQAQLQADRNLSVQTCTSRYAATSTAWEDEADRLEARVIKIALEDQPVDVSLGARSVIATENASEMTRRRIGLAELAEQEIGDTTGFSCPPIPERLTVDSLDPTDASRPPIHS
jgi:hypothetical protein